MHLKENLSVHYILLYYTFIIYFVEWSKTIYDH